LKKSRTAAAARGWEELARLDPLWAVASTPELRHGKWNEEEFYAVGRRKARKLMKRLDALGVPARMGRALDFGCGAGRLTLPLIDHFSEVVGVDIAPSMLELARTRSGGRSGLEFRLDETGDQSLLASETFDLVYSGLVLQHLPSLADALACLERLCAAVGRGGALVVQVPVWLSEQGPRRIRQRLYTALRRVGVPARVLYSRAGLHPMTMICVPRERAEACMQSAGLEIMRVDERADDAIVSLTIYAARRG
jgi:SAM-dependent methyltransferase